MTLPASALGTTRLRALASCRSVISNTAVRTSHLAPYICIATIRPPHSSFRSNPGFAPKVRTLGKVDHWDTSPRHKHKIL